MMVAVVNVGIASCGGDDDVTPPIESTNPLVGIWERSEMIQGDKVVTTLTFNKDNTYSEVSRIGKAISNSESGKYSYDADAKCLVTIPNNGSRTWTYYVRSITSSTLVLVFEDYSGSITYTKK